LPLYFSRHSLSMLLLLSSPALLYQWLFYPDRHLTCTMHAVSMTPYVFEYLRELKFIFEKALAP
jgi:hypothetical protein